VERKRGERYSQKFRGQTVERMNACENILRLSRELGIHRRLLYKWRRALSSHFVKPVSLTSCLDAHLRDLNPDDVEPLSGPGNPLVASDRCEPCATALYSLAAVTSTVCETPSMSWIGTRQDRTGIGAR
jgi:hypothetical protein